MEGSVCNVNSLMPVMSIHGYLILVLCLVFCADNAGWTLYIQAKTDFGCLSGHTGQDLLDGALHSNWNFPNFALYL